jgi:hypothetical protein
MFYGQIHPCKFSTMNCVLQLSTFFSTNLWLCLTFLCCFNDIGLPTLIGIKHV